MHRTTQASLSALAMAIALAMAPQVFAEDSEKETPVEEQEAKLAELDLPQAVIDHIAYLEDLEERYPDVSKIDPKALLEQEGEKAALLYCKAIGFEGPCTIDESKEDARFEAVDLATLTSARMADNWWRWLNADIFTAIGVVPETRDCARPPYAPRPMVQMHMDDEDRRNNNSRHGWIGATSSGGNTTWRFCRISTQVQNGEFRPLPYAAPYGNYAVLQMGLRCPRGARTIKRRQDNEDWRNANWQTGNTYPSVNSGGRNWITYYCHFDGAALGASYMNAFPHLGISYGVFASELLPREYAIQYGYVYQDDEDWFNMNAWMPSSINTNVMGGGSNTWRKLAKVR
jgi:hypothetical protein